MKLIGEYLRELTDLDTENLIEALRHQVGLKDKGDHTKLGAILISLGMAKEEDVSTALEMQKQDRAEIPGSTFTVSSISYWVSRGPRSQ